MGEDEHGDGAGDGNEDWGQYFMVKPEITANCKQDDANPENIITDLLERHQSHQCKYGQNGTKNAQDVEQEDINTDETKSKRHDGVGQEKRRSQ